MSDPTDRHRPADGHDRERGAFLDRVRSAVRRAAPPTPGAIPSTVEARAARTVEPGGNPVDLFQARATGAGIHVRTCARRDLEPSIGAFLAERGIRSVAVAIGESSLAASVDRAVVQAGARALPTPPGSPEPYFNADCGITDVSGAIAESGTLVLSSDRHGRAGFMVPPVHVALVRAEAIVPDLLDLWAPGTAAPVLPSSLVLVSGPSKTADIEGILVTGVHGPREVHVFIIQGAAGSSAPSPGARP